ELFAESAEPPDADPHVRWCGRGGGVTRSPMPIFVMILMGAFFAVAFAGIAFHQPAALHGSLPPGFIVLFPVMWLGMMGWWVFMLVVAIVYGIKAGRGEWAEYPVLGRLARRILRIGPGGRISGVICSSVSVCLPLLYTDLFAPRHQALD
ncbi:MAG: hypothetical protein WAN41_12450, partial [Candidatus Sulfotelmatobacter sp.]